MNLKYKFFSILVSIIFCAFPIISFADDFYEDEITDSNTLEVISQDYSNLDFDATKIQQQLADPDNLSLLKDVLTKLG